MTASISNTVRTTLQTINNASTLVNVLTTPASIQIEQDSVFSFTIDLTGIRESDGAVYRRRLIGTVKNIGGTTTLIGGAVTEDANYSLDEFSPDTPSYFVSVSGVELQVDVQLVVGTATEWVAWVEGTMLEF